jgi:hypothetical protein
MATIPVKLMYDENNQPFVPLISLDSIEDIQGTSVQEMLDAKLEAANIIAGNQIELEIDGNNITINNAASGMNIIDNLDTTESGVGSLDARQGNELKNMIPKIANDLNTRESGQALSALQGYVLAGRSVPVGGLNGQVLMKSADNDYSVTWGDAADPNAIVGDGTIKKIVELSYQDYLDLKDGGQLDETTEYHINDWTESGLVEIKADQVMMSDGLDVEEVIRDDQGHIVNLSNRMDAVEGRLENKDTVDEGQNTRLDIAEGNIDAVVSTVNSHATQLGALTVSSGYWYPDLAVVGQNTRPTWTIESRRANYYRIGRLVFVDFYMKGKITALPSNTNYAIITGLPYSATNNAAFGQQALTIGTVYSALSSGSNLAFVVYGNQIRIQDGYGSHATEYVVTSGSFFELAGSGTYIID